MTRYEQAIDLWRGYGIQTTEELDKYLDSFRVLFAYNSTKIENAEVSYHDTREVFEDGRVNSFAGDPRTLFEVQNQKTCYSFLLPKIVAAQPLSIGLIKEIHAILTAGTYDERRFLDRGERPCDFKRHDYVTGIFEAGSLPEDVEQDITGLLDELSDASDTMEPIKVLTTAAYLHARFESIHPFADGNGRVGRTLVNYYLMIYGHPPLIVYEEDRKEYYMALQSYDENDDITSLLEFFLYQVEKTWEKKLSRMEQRGQ